MVWPLVKYTDTESALFTYDDVKSFCTYTKRGRFHLDIFIVIFKFSLYLFSIFIRLLHSHCSTFGCSTIYLPVTCSGFVSLCFLLHDLYIIFFLPWGVIIIIIIIILVVISYICIFLWDVSQLYQVTNFLKSPAPFSRNIILDATIRMFLLKFSISKKRYSSKFYSLLCAERGSFPFFIENILVVIFLFSDYSSILSISFHFGTNYLFKRQPLEIYVHFHL